MPHTRFRGVRVKKAKPPHWGVHALQRSLEGFIVYHADLLAWLLPVQSGLMLESSLTGPGAEAMIKSVNLKVNPRALKGQGPDAVKPLYEQLKKQASGHTPAC